MPVSATSLLEAATRNSIAGEDRLTEVVASVLGSVPELTDRLFGDERRDTSQQQFEVNTQVPTHGRRRLDLEVVSPQDGRRLWCENKLWAAYSPNQLEDYGEEAHARWGAACRLLTIVPAARLREITSDLPEGWTAATWEWLSEQADAVGRGAGGPRWRDAATASESIALLRQLHELVRYLEMEGFASLRPMGHTEIVAVSNAHESLTLVEEMLDRASTYISMHTAEGPNWRTDDYGVCWLTFDDSSGAWPSAIDGWPELIVADRDEWARSRIGEPAFGAGWTISGEWAFDELRGRADWRALVESEGFSVGRGWQNTRIFRTLYMAELVPYGVTFDQQASRLAEWAQESIERLIALDPGQIEGPPARRRRKRPVQAEAGPVEDPSETPIDLP